MIDEEAADEKIISVCVNDPSMSGYSDISELPPHILDEIKHFFIVYKQLENKTTFVTEIDGVDEAKRVIQASIDAYNDLYLK
jgi:inorganic pyrophosphatase